MRTQLLDRVTGVSPEATDGSYTVEATVADVRVRFKDLGALSASGKVTGKRPAGRTDETMSRVRTASKANRALMWGTIAGVLTAGVIGAIWLAYLQREPETDAAPTPAPRVIREP